MISGSEVMDPCPISVAGDMMVIVPSSAMLTQGLSALPLRALAGAAALAGLPASAIVNVRPAAPVMTCRRDSRVLALLMCFVMAQASRAARSTARTMR
jgi:hypothetical protein